MNTHQLKCKHVALFAHRHVHQIFYRLLVSILVGAYPEC